MSTRASHQLLANVPLDKQASNANEYRLFKPEVFVLGEAGTAHPLIVDVGVWEWNTVGVYDLATGELQALGGQVHTDLLPLSDDRALLYGNNGMAGDFALHMADSLDDINTYTEAIGDVSVTNVPLFVEQAVEIAPGIIRVFGSTIPTTPDEVSAFYFDYDITAGEAGEVNFVTLSTSEESTASLDGRHLRRSQNCRSDHG